MGWLSAPVSVLRGAWAHTAEDKSVRSCSGPSAKDLPRWDTVAFRQTLSDCKKEPRFSRDTLDQLQAISRVLLTPKQPVPFEVTSELIFADNTQPATINAYNQDHVQAGSPAWSACKPAPPSIPEEVKYIAAHHEATAADRAASHTTSACEQIASVSRPGSQQLQPAEASNAATAAGPSVSAQLDLLSDMADMALSHSQQQLRWLHNCDCCLDVQLTTLSRPTSAAAPGTPLPMPARSRSSSDLQHGSFSKEEFAEDLRDAQQQAAEANEELQRLREDSEQLRVALASALSQTQQLGALQSEVSMLKGQLEETRQMTQQSMNRSQSTVSLPYDQVHLLEKCRPCM